METTAISFEEIPPTIGEMVERIETTLQSYPYLVAEREKRTIGFAYASQHRARAAYRWSVDVTVYVAEHSRRCGVAHALYTELLSMLVENSFHSAFAGITLPNAGSTALHEAMGFEQLGIYREVRFKFGQWHDVGWWQRILKRR